MNWLKMLIIILTIITCFTGAFAYRNLHYDYRNYKFMKKRGKALGFVEKIYISPDGSEISYLEGPKNGEALLLIHGQMVSKEDYANVLPELSKYFHIFAVDCYGNGKSSKNYKKYNIVSICDDMIIFIKEVIKENVLISGHSSGALISAEIAAKNKEQVMGLLLEDGPFFSTEKGRAEKTLAYLEFKLINDFLSQTELGNYTNYYLDHTYFREIFNKDGRDNWKFLVKNPYKKRIKIGKRKIPLVWYYPPKAKLNQLVLFTGNLQDGTGDYDLRFGKAFYDFSWFRGFNQEKTLGEIDCPTIILHVAPPRYTAPSYYDKNGILISAMDDKDAYKVKSLVKQSKLKSGYESMHDIHADLPGLFIKAILELKSEGGKDKFNII